MIPLTRADLAEEALREYDRIRDMLVKQGLAAYLRENAEGWGTETADAVVCKVAACSHEEDGCYAERSTLDLAGYYLALAEAAEALQRQEVTDDGGNGSPDDGPAG